MLHTYYNFYFLFFFSFFSFFKKIPSHPHLIQRYIVQYDLGFLTPKYWHYRPEPPHLAYHTVFSNSVVVETSLQQKGVTS